MIKGVDFDADGLVLVSENIRRALGLDVSVLMGANVAEGVAKEEFCEATVGAASPAAGALWARVFDRPYFRVSACRDVYAVELCGALKNIVALAAGFCDGLQLGSNTKAALIRIGLAEMVALIRLQRPDTQLATFFESCGVGDLVTTCYAGRNRRCAEAFVRTGKPWAALEAELLGGQKLQGTLAAVEVHKMLARAGRLAQFPLFVLVHRIAAGEAKPQELTLIQRAAEAPPNSLVSSPKL